MQTHIYVAKSIRRQLLNIFPTGFIDENEKAPALLMQEPLNLFNCFYKFCHNKIAIG